MKIQKLIRIENFEGIKSTPKKIEFKDFNIIFGDNGSGKSRVVRAIKAFVENRKIEKHYFFPTEPSEISFEIDGTVYTLDDSQKYIPNPVADLEKNVAIFDLDFIINNLKIEPDEQGNKLISIAGFDLCSNLINTIEKVIDEVINFRFIGFSTGFTKALLNLQNGLPSDNSISTQLNNISFDFTKKENWKANKHINTLNKIQSSISLIETLTESKLKKLKDENAELDTQIENFETDKTNLEEFLLLTYNYEKQSIDTQRIKKSITTFKSAISKLSELDQYSENQIEFIKLGLKLLSSSSNCPFCLQDISQKETQSNITDYRNLVKSLAVDSKQEFIDDLKEYIETLTNIPSSDDIDFKDYTTQFKLIKNIMKDIHFSIWKKKNISTRNIKSLKEHLVEIKHKVEQDKVKSINEINQELLVRITSELSLINSTLTDNKAKFNSNKLIAQKVYNANYKVGINKLTEKRNTNTRIIKEQEDIQKLKNKDTILTVLLTNLTEINKIDELIISIKSLNTDFTGSLVKEMDNFGNDYGNYLQEYYRHFYPNGVFNYIDWSSKTSRTAGKFKYKVGISAKNTFLKNKVGKKPDLVLSEGNYNALALAYFFAINEKMNPSIIRFDDPITGMDSGKRLQLIRLILDLSKSKQVFVFTHDILFKSYLCDAISEHINTNLKNINKKLTHTRYYNVFLSDDILKFLSNENIYDEILSQLKSLTSKTAFTELEISTAFGTLRLGLEYFLHKKLIKNIPNQNGFSERLRRYKNILENPISEVDRITLKNIHLACSKSGPHLDSTGGDSATYLKRLIQEFLTIETKVNY